VSAHAGGVKVAQAVAALSNPKLKIDGIVGAQTRKAIQGLGPDAKKATNNILQSAGLPDLDKLMNEQLPSNDSFRAVVGAVASEAKKRGLDPSYYLAQIVLETGWGRSVPRLPNGQSSNNYAGLKYESVKTQVKGKTSTTTLEYLKGLPQTVRDAFAVFDTPGDFARVYFWYLLDSPSAYRYKGLEAARSAQEFGNILQKGGYATDPAYADKVAAAANSVVARYGSDINNAA